MAAAQEVFGAAHLAPPHGSCLQTAANWQAGSRVGQFEEPARQLAPTSYGNGGSLGALVVFGSHGFSCYRRLYHCFCRFVAVAIVASQPNLAPSSCGELRAASQSVSQSLGLTLPNCAV